MTVIEMMKQFHREIKLEADTDVEGTPGVIVEQPLECCVSEQVCCVSEQVCCVS